MAEVAQLGTLQGRLCGILAAAVARHVTANDKASGPGRKGARFEHHFSSAFERAARTLLSLGVIAPVPRASNTRNPLAYEHTLSMDADAMPGFLAGNMPAGDDRLQEIVTAFVAIACDFGGLSSERKPFVPPPAYAESVRMLERHGYAERVGDQYRWTDKIGPAMRANYLWDDQLSSYATQWEADVSAEAEAAWRTMPDQIRRQFFANRPVPFIEFVRVLCLCWKDGAWHATSQEGRVRLRGEVELARRIIDIADGRDRRRQPTR